MLARLVFRQLDAMPIRWWEWLAVVLLAAATVALRWHTITEPLDCDEATYAYVAHRLLKGDRLYVDVFENKPPLAYLPYAAAVAVGGLTERAIRWLPVPFCLVTLWFVWRTGRQFAGPPAALMAASLYTVLQADPFVFGNGANLELYMNPLLAAGFWLLLRYRFLGPNGRREFALGLCLGAATAIKQVAGLYVLLSLAVLVIGPVGERISWGTVLKATVVFLIGAAAPWIGCAAFCAGQGSFEAFVEAVFVYAPELARQAFAELYERYALPPAEPIQMEPAAVIISTNQKLLVLTQWFLTGNPMANAWWGTVMMPAFVLALGGAIRAILVPGLSPAGALAGWWMLVTVAVVAWPGLFWQHYYMLFVPIVAVLCARFVTLLWLAPGGRRGGLRLALARWGVLFVLALIPVNLFLSYARHSPEEITTQCKGGGQWVAIRSLGKGLRQALGDQTRLFVWGWQSPLYVYTGFESVTPYFFTDPLMQAYVDGTHPMVEPRKRRIIEDLRKHAPEVVFVGERPYRELRRLLDSGYINVDTVGRGADPRRLDGRGLYIRRDVLDRLR